ncbi:MAG: CPBP family intramembrane metalloprotease [Candidatus Pacebacteria bacterium]|nr:CPBP family intramembrane metalloprotease [Candidatus Paceibacterota bacterium]
MRFAIFFHEIFGLTLVCLLLLIREKGVAKHLFWHTDGLKAMWRGILLRSILVAVVVTGLVMWISPNMLFAFPRRKPLVWLVVMILYPPLSAYPQELVYRTFFFHRYRALFRKEWTLVAASAGTYAFMHIVFDNIPAVVLTAAAGVSFCWTFRRSHSLAAVALEHALYGNIVFTIGLGRFFYEGF